MSLLLLHNLKPWPHGLCSVWQSQWKLHDYVEVDGRSGTICLDLRPEHNYACVLWTDTNTKSEVICADNIAKLSPQKIEELKVSLALCCEH